MSDITAWPAYENMARLVLKDGLPPTTIVPVDQGNMFFEYTEHYSKQSVRGQRLPRSWFIEAERPEIQTIGII